MQEKLIVIDDKEEDFGRISCCSHDAVSFEVSSEVEESIIFQEEVSESEFDFGEFVVVLDGSEKSSNVSDE